MAVLFETLVPLMLRWPGKPNKRLSSKLPNERQHSIDRVNKKANLKLFWLKLAICDALAITNKWNVQGIRCVGKLGEKTKNGCWLNGLNYTIYWGFIHLFCRHSKYVFYDVNGFCWSQIYPSLEWWLIHSPTAIFGVLGDRGLRSGRVLESAEVPKFDAGLSYFSLNYPFFYWK